LSAVLPAPASLRSAGVPEPDGDDHVRGAGPPAVIYLDLACPRCAASWAEIRPLPLRLCVRHFPVASRRPRSPALHAAAEAVARQSEPAFWDFWDSLLADRARVDDPHLWRRVESLGLDLQRFQRDRRDDAVAARVRRDFESGIRAGVVATPAGFAGGRPLGGDLPAALRRIASRGGAVPDRARSPHL
jgi:protein-disulfide isomerase